MDEFGGYLPKDLEIVMRKNMSIGDSARYMRWVAEELENSFRQHRRPPRLLVAEIGAMLSEAIGWAESAEKLEAETELEHKNEKYKSNLDDVKSGARNALLCGFGLKQEKRTRQIGIGEKPAAFYFEVVSFLFDHKRENESKLREELVRDACEKFNVSRATIHRYWSKYKEEVRDYRIIRLAQHKVMQDDV